MQISIKPKPSKQSFSQPVKAIQNKLNLYIRSAIEWYPPLRVEQQAAEPGMKFPLQMLWVSSPKQAMPSARPASRSEYLKVGSWQHQSFVKNAQGPRSSGLSIHYQQLQWNWDSLRGDNISAPPADGEEGAERPDWPLLTPPCHWKFNSRSLKSAPFYSLEEWWTFSVWTSASWMLYFWDLRAAKNIK